MITFVSVFAVSCLFVFIKAFQQLNVVHDKYLWVMPCSMLMALCEVFVISMIAVKQEWWLFIPMGIGSALGAMFSMYLHKRIMN